MEKKEKKEQKKLYKAAVIIGGLVLTAACIWYFYKVNYYQTHFFKNTYLNGREAGGMTADQAAKLLIAETAQYSLQIMGRNEQGETVELGIISAEQIDLAAQDALSDANDLLAQQNAWRWMEMLSGSQYSYHIVQGLVFDEELLRQTLSSLEAFQKKNMIAPQDAYIGELSEEKGVYEVVAEVSGTQLDMEAVLTSVSNAISTHAESVDLAEAGCYILPEVTGSDEELLDNLATVNRWLSAEIIYDWNGAEVVVDIDVIKEWVSVEGEEPLLDQEAVADFVAEQAYKYDTYGKTRSFKTTLGAELQLPSGAFGWKTDREQETDALIQLIQEGARASREPIYSHTAPEKGLSDIGSSYVEADLTNQHLYLYYQGELVLETDFVSGKMSDPGSVTPQGVFGLTYKTTNAVLRGQNYETPVNYWMPFHGNFGMHDATWRTEFGGQIYLTSGSHGCLNLPLDKAGALYSYLYTGYPVICYYLPAAESEAPAQE